MKSMPAAFAAVALFSLACAEAPAEKPAEKAVERAPEKPAVDIAAETASLLAADKAFYESADVEKRMSFFADDAVRLGPGQGALIGRAAIQARAAELKALPGFAVESEARTAQVAASGDMGYTFGAGKASVRTGSKTLTVPGHSLTIWRKQGGAWKIVADAVSATPGAETTK